MSSPNDRPTWRGLDVDHRRVFVIADLEVPEYAATRLLRDVLEVVGQLREHGATTILLGRFSGSPENLGAQLATLGDLEIMVPDEVVGDGTIKLVRDSRPGEVILLPSLTDEVDSAALAGLGDILVHDAPASAWRSGLESALADRFADRAPGPRLERLVEVIDGWTRHAKPRLLLLGEPIRSPAVNDAIAQLEAGETLVIGGSLIEPFLTNSAAPSDDRRAARDLVQRAAGRDIRVVIPRDLATSAGNLKTADGLPTDAEVDGLGTGSIADLNAELERANTVLWLGSLGSDADPAAAERLRQHSGMLVCGGSAPLRALGEADALGQPTLALADGRSILELLDGNPLPGWVAVNKETH